MLVRKLVSFALLAVLAIAAPAASGLLLNPQEPVQIADGGGPGGDWLVPPSPDLTLDS